MLRNVVLTRATRRNIPEDAILHSHRREKLKSYTLFNKVLSVFVLQWIIYSKYFTEFPSDYRAVCARETAFDSRH
jgi:hypothetical protein